MTMISDIWIDLVEEILSRVPITSLGKVRSACKLWNSLSKEESFRKKHCDHEARKEYLVNMTSRRFSLQNIKKYVASSPHKYVVKEIGQMPRPGFVKEGFEVGCFQGLLLYNPKDDSGGFEVWNPYLSQTRWIEIRNSYAIGYDNNNNYKVLGSFYDYKAGYMKHLVYYLKSNSWRLLDITSNFHVQHNDVSLNGNTYFVGRKQSQDSFVICFDFTTERFGPILHLPFHSGYGDDVILSSVRDEQLALLHHKSRTRELEIWITTKIEPNMISWSKFFKVGFNLELKISSFFISKVKQVAVVCGRYFRHFKGEDCYMYRSYVVGVDRCYEETGFKGDVFSYVPSSASII